MMGWYCIVVYWCIGRSVLGDDVYEWYGGIECVGWVIVFLF